MLLPRNNTADISKFFLVVLLNLLFGVKIPNNMNSKLVERIIESKVPQRPEEWAMKVGWTKYKDGDAIPVDYPDESILVFDVETMVKVNNIPIIAVAVSDTHW